MIDMNLLLVEDNDLDVQILKRSLNKLGYSGSLVRARDGLDALDVLIADASDRTLPRPYVILLDINMPRMNGHEFLEAVRANEKLKAARVIFFTTSNSQKDVSLAYRNNANGYIVKPQGSSELQKILSALHQYWSVCEHPSG